MSFSLTSLLPHLPYSLKATWIYSRHFWSWKAHISGWILINLKFSQLASPPPLPSCSIMRKTAQSGNTGRRFLLRSTVSHEYQRAGRDHLHWRGGKVALPFIFLFTQQILYLPFIHIPCSATHYWTLLIDKVSLIIPEYRKTYMLSPMQDNGTCDCSKNYFLKLNLVLAIFWYYGSLCSWIYLNVTAAFSHFARSRIGRWQQPGFDR